MSLNFGYSPYLETIEEDIDMNGYKIIDLPSPTTDSEPVTKGYADTHYSRGGSGQRKETRETPDRKDRKETKAIKGIRETKATLDRKDPEATPAREV